MTIKVTIELELEKMEGPSYASDKVVDILVEEVEATDLWLDDTHYAIRVRQGMIGW